MGGAPQDPLATVIDLRKPFDWQKLVLFILVCAGALWTLSDKLAEFGKGASALKKAESSEATINQLAVDVVRAKLQAEGANAAALRVETKVDDQSRKLERMNDVLMQIRITGKR